ncbi:hypothetical protein [Curtobacterium sp. MCBD17_040]|uniref:hypothetical protein n=1 Tax=Curtobacterium sp. MCBD17_040 TaxID=2175674 RepID=UPI000DA7E17C|nr:hypothetical protein [Curtobacterium sp. MCBD17_040]WIB65469.1 hypothetical protein DEI94_19035 [Curtobacterium sp. MCBD17_040]
MPAPTIAPPTTAATAERHRKQTALYLTGTGAAMYRTEDETYAFTRALPQSMPTPQHTDFDHLLIDGLIAFDDPWASGNLRLHLTPAGRVALDAGYVPAAA